MSLGLVMIVKNEEATLPRLAANLQGHIDHATIADTGSTDNTFAVAQTAFGMASTVFHVPWDGFGPARNTALEEAEKHTDWLLSLDADETIEGDWFFDTPEDVDCVEIEMRFGNLSYWVPRIFRSGRGFRWHGRAHEYLAIPGRDAVATRVHSIWIAHHADGGSRGDKFEREIALLQEDWEEHHDARSAFYLARTYEDGGQFAEAERWYRTRLSMPGWSEETFYARYSLGKCLLALGASDEACGSLWASWGLCSSRGDPLVALAEHYRQSNQWMLAWQAARLAEGYHEPAYLGLFMDTSLAWRIPYELSIAAWYTGYKEVGRSYEERLLGMDLPEPYRSSVRSNAVWYCQDSPVGKWDPWYENAAHPSPIGPDTLTYRLGAEFLSGCDVIEDWGCGLGWLRNYVPSERYIGLDGSASPFADQVVDLESYTSQSSGIFMRHVLEHNHGWEKILTNAVASFRERFVLITATPHGERTHVLGNQNVLGVPEISLATADITRHFEGLAWRSETHETDAYYGTETIFYVTRPSES